MGARALPVDRPWPGGRRRRGFWRALPLRLLALAALGLAVAAAAYLVQQARLARPTVPKVAVLAQGLPTSAAPDPLAGAPGVLAASVDGVEFPDYRTRGFRAIGLRRDTIAGRDAVTVSYVHGHRRLTYTIVSGTNRINYATAALTNYREAASGPRLELSFLAAGPGRVLTFKRRGHTVVMTTPGEAGVSAATMARLANWRAAGRLAF